MTARFKYESGAADAHGRALDQFIITGAEHSAKQAARARGAKISTRATQKAAGGLFAEKETPAPDLFNCNPRRRNTRVTRLQRNAYTTARGLESGLDLDFATTMRIARTRGGSLERYERLAGTPKFADEDPLDSFSPKQRPIYRERKRRSLQVFRDDEGIKHPIRNSPGYDASKTKHDRGYHPPKGKAEKMTRNPKSRTKKKTAAPRTARRSAPSSGRPAVRVNLDNAAAAVSRAAVALRLDQMSQKQLVKLHNAISRRRKKTFTDVAVMNAAKVAAMAKGATVRK